MLTAGGVAKTLGGGRVDYLLEAVPGVPDDQRTGMRADRPEGIGAAEGGIRPGRSAREREG